MTALEQQLTKALRALSAQYEQAQQQHAAQVETLPRSLGAAGRAAQRASDALGPGLQDARRDVARALDLMRQRGRERDHGPSR